MNKKLHFTTGFLGLVRKAATGNPSTKDAVPRSDCAGIVRCNSLKKSSVLSAFFIKFTLYCRLTLNVL